MILPTELNYSFRLTAPWANFSELPAVSSHGQTLQELQGIQLRRLVTTLFDVPIDADDDTLIDAGIRFALRVAKVLPPDQAIALVTTLRNDLTHRFVSELDLSIAAQLSLSASDWLAHDQKLLALSAAEASMDAAELAVARQLGISPLEWTKNRP